VVTSKLIASVAGFTGSGFTGSAGFTGGSGFTGLYKFSYPTGGCVPLVTRFSGKPPLDTPPSLVDHVVSVGDFQRSFFLPPFSSIVIKSVSVVGEDLFFCFASGPATLSHLLFVDLTVVPSLW